MRSRTMTMKCAGLVGAGLLAGGAIATAVHAAPEDIAATGAAATALEGVASHEVLATFIPPTLVPPYTADVVWDDPASVQEIGAALVVPRGGGQFAVVGNQIMEEEGIFRGSVTITDGNLQTAVVRCAVTAGETVPVLSDVTLVLGSDRLTATLAGSYEDRNDESHSLTVNWGDGRTETFDLGTGMTGQFSKTHKYSAAAAAKLRAPRPALHVVVTVQDTDGTPGLPEVLPNPLGTLAPFVPKLSAACKGTPGPACFLEQVFIDGLGRKPTTPEVNQLVGDVGTPQDRIDTVAQLLRRREARTLWVLGMYSHHLGRKPKPGELNSAIAKLGSTNAGEDSVLQGILGSAEYFKRSGNTNSKFIRFLAIGVLGHPADPSHFDLFETTTGGGGTRADFALEVLRSVEARRRIVNAAFYRFLRRTADPAGMSDALDAIEAGADTPGVIGRIVGVRSEYQDRAGRYAVPPRRTKGVPLDWNAVAFAFLGRSLDRNRLASVTDLIIDPFTAARALPAILLGHPAHLQRTVDNHYRVLLGRDATAQERSDGVQFLEGTGTVAELMSQILGSPEYFNGPGGGTNAGFVDALRRDAVGTYTLTIGPNVVVDPSNPNVVYLNGLLDAGASRADVARHVLESATGLAARIEGFHQQWMLRGADTTGAAVLLSAMEAGATDDAVITGLVGSIESFRRFAKLPPGIKNRAAGKSYIRGVRIGMGVPVPAVESNDLLTNLTRPDGRFIVSARLALFVDVLRIRVDDFLTRYTANTLSSAQLPTMFLEGASEEDVIVRILSSSQYFSRAHLVATGVNGATTSEDLVTAVYMHLLGRSPTQNELDRHLLPVVDDPFFEGNIAPDVALEVLTSEEFRTNFLDALTTATLGRASTAAERLRFVNSSLGIADMRIAFLATRKGF